MPQLQFKIEAHRKINAKYMFKLLFNALYHSNFHYPKATFTK
ncbi:hypothetical protein GNIT_0878 [Glaciecola nitratireducens FR1064]|uniref:Uncharacterized protein n=1 Tax=Glaciecola nitratireducens (strain JCM 12485 / KCTC 12276 / FR1064) TaxID=1085623 RepID=G4QJX4_GLANF|nr:hypothetical protein GNIT_0878 [Glaciecola nitratireducens FR1064]